jgi:hypothetical protein
VCYHNSRLPGHTAAAPPRPEQRYSTAIQQPAAAPLACDAGRTVASASSLVLTLLKRVPEWRESPAGAGLGTLVARVARALLDRSSSLRWLVFAELTALLTEVMNLGRVPIYRRSWGSVALGTKYCKKNVRDIPHQTRCVGDHTRQKVIGGLQSASTGVTMSKRTQCWHALVMLRIRSCVFDMRVQQTCCQWHDNRSASITGACAVVGS